MTHTLSLIKPPHRFVITYDAGDENAVMALQIGQRMREDVKPIGTEAKR